MWIRPAQRWENIEVRGGSGKVSGSGLARRYLGHTNRSRGKEYRPVANFLLSKRIDLDRRTKSEGYVSKSPISCKLPLVNKTNCWSHHLCERRAYIQLCCFRWFLILSHLPCVSALRCSSGAVS